MDNKIETLEVRVKEHTLQKIDRLQAMVKSPSRSDAVRRSLDISDTILNNILNGGRIILEDRGGKKSQIFIMGLNA